MILIGATAVLFGGCEPAHDKSSLVDRVADGLREVGASATLTKCLVADLDDHLAEADAERAYEDLASEPEVSESSLNRASLLEQTVKERLLARASICRSSLVSRGRYSHAEIDRMLRAVSGRGYREPDLFLAP
ncbi:MAG TPA: hypothetical protein VGW80_11280 [Solirubrobacterales bacterium]|nr:hypothetical protein [Solirubrobacterales bacterium]